MRMFKFVGTGPVPGLVRLEALAALDAADLACLEQRLADTGRVYSARRELYPSGTRLRRPLLVAEGWACRFRFLGDGRRQILSFYLPGDVIGPVLPASIGSITRLSLFEPPVVDKAGDTGIACVLAASAARDEVYLLNQIARLGRQTAYGRMAHLMLELRDRLWPAGLADETGFPMPLTQEMLADALGLSNVHVNRTLQALRRDKMLVLENGRARIMAPEALATQVNYAPVRI